MSHRPDILVKTRSGHPFALVEVKNVQHLSTGMAAEIRDELVQHAAKEVRYVIVVSQSAAYLWQLQREPSSAKIDYGRPQVLDMAPVFREYLSEAELSRHFRGAELDLVLSHWLGDLARGRTDVLPQTPEPGPLLDFVSEIRGAQVNLEALA